MSSMTSPEARAGEPRRRWTNKFAKLIRWLHIYASMLGLAVTLFFSITGLTLNHPDWFPTSEIARDAEGDIDPQILTADKDGPDKLALVELLRERHHITARLKDFFADEYQCVVAFAGPAYTADVFVDMASGHYELHEVSLGIVPFINDLHKGRDTGRSWSWLIDISAILLTFISITGFLLIFWLKRKLSSSVIVALIGTLVLLALACMA